MTTSNPELINVTVSVEGGELAVHEFAAARPDAPVVIALHGITANAFCWPLVSRALAGRVRLLAPDLRGRAASRDVGPPYGLGAHVADVIAVMDAYGLDDAVVVGHSMGGFVAALAAVRQPDRVRSLVVIDGGLSLGTIAVDDIDAAIHAVIGPAMTRLSMTFADVEEYLDFWRPHPAFGPVLEGPHAAEARAYLEHDLVSADDGRVRSSCRIDAIRADGADVLADEETVGGLVRSGRAATLLYADHGMLGAAPGLYDAERLAAMALPTRVSTIGVRDVNHYSILFADHAVAAIAAAVLEHADA